MSSWQNEHKSFPSSTRRSKHPLELVYIELHQLSTPTHDGYPYWIIFIDDYSCYPVVILLKFKSQAFLAFQHYKSLADKHINRSILTLQDDKGGEYISNEFLQFCAK